jgi:hypothetical protein
VVDRGDEQCNGRVPAEARVGSILNKHGLYTEAILNRKRGLTRLLIAAMSCVTAVYPPSPAPTPKPA